MNIEYVDISTNIGLLPWQKIKALPVEFKSKCH